MSRFDRVVDRLCAVDPAYLSVTYGAGGSTRERTLAVVEHLQARGRGAAGAAEGAPGGAVGGPAGSAVPISHHLTCVAATRAEIQAQARDLWDRGIRKVVALRGDPQGGAPYTPPADGYPYAADLVEGLLAVAPFDIAVAAYPEVHPEAPSAAADLDNLKRKQDAGARVAITQYAFDTDQVLRFVDRARAAGITMPIVPGIMPVADLKGLIRFSEKCGATVPDWLRAMFAGLDADPATRAMVATAVASEQCRRLMAAGLDEFHLYTLNRAEVSVAVCRALGLSDAGPLADPARQAAAGSATQAA